MDNIIYMLAVNAIPLLFAITLHEAAHGYAARMFGDRTAEMLGRISLNPIKHIDPIGTLLIPGVLILLKSPYRFGRRRCLGAGGARRTRRRSFRLRSSIALLRPPPVPGRPPAAGGG